MELTPSESNAERLSFYNPRSQCLAFPDASYTVSTLSFSEVTIIEDPNVNDLSAQDF